MTTPTTPLPTAREVVADYLAAKAETDRPERQREITTAYTESVIDELPDGFTAKDVRVCVGVLCDTDPDLAGFTSGKRSRAVTKALNDAVADGALELKGDEYHHTATV